MIKQERILSTVKGGRGLKLTIEYIKGYERPWLLKREDGEYNQHAHFYTKKEAEKVKNLIEVNRYPKNKDQKYAMQKILTENEFKKLCKKDRYFNPGVKRRVSFCVR